MDIVRCDARRKGSIQDAFRPQKRTLFVASLFGNRLPLITHNQRIETVDGIFKFFNTVFGASALVRDQGQQHCEDACG